MNADGHLRTPSLPTQLLPLLSLPSHAPLARPLVHLLVLGPAERRTGTVLPRPRTHRRVSRGERIFEGHQQRARGRQAGRGWRRSCCSYWRRRAAQPDIQGELEQPEPLRHVSLQVRRLRILLRSTSNADPPQSSARSKPSSRRTRRTSLSPRQTPQTARAHLFLPTRLATRPHFLTRTCRFTQRTTLDCARSTSAARSCSTCARARTWRSTTSAGGGSRGGSGSEAGRGRKWRISCSSHRVLPGPCKGGSNSIAACDESYEELSLRATQMQALWCAEYCATIHASHQSTPENEEGRKKNASPHLSDRCPAREFP